MTSKILFVLLIPLLYSCYHVNQPAANVPDHLLNEEEMASIITDVQLVEGALSYRRTLRIEQKDFRESAYQQLFSTYGITARVLNDNIRYYNNEPEKMELIYEQVLAKLSRIQSELTDTESKTDSTSVED